MNLSELGQPGARRRLGLFAGLLAVVLIGLTWHDLSRNYFRGDWPTSPANDFLHEYVGGWLVVHGDQARFYDPDYIDQLEHDRAVTGFQWTPGGYHPIIYPPFYYLLVAPLSLLSIQVAMTNWLLLMVGCLAVTLILWIRAYPAWAFAAWLIPITMLYPPSMEQLVSGQKATLLLLLLTATFVLMRNGMPGWAGLVFGLVAFKPHLGLVVGLTFLCKRQWRFVAGSLATVLVLVGLCFVVGTDVCAQYAARGRSMAQYIDSPGYDLTRAHSWYGFYRLLGPDVDLGTIQMLTLLASAITVALLVVLFHGPLEPASPRFALQFSGLVVALVVLSPHFYTYDMVMLLLPMFLMMMVVLECRGQLAPREVLGAWLVLGIFYVITSVSTYLAQLMPVQLSVPAMLAFLLAVVWLERRLDQVAAQPRLG